MAAASGTRAALPAGRLLHLTDRAAAVLRPELEYRLRFIIQEALKLARHANRRAVLPEDLVLAYNAWCSSGILPFSFRTSERAALSSRSATCTLTPTPLHVFGSLYELLGSSSPLPFLSRESAARFWEEGRRELPLSEGVGGRSRRVMRARMQPRSNYARISALP